LTAYATTSTNLAASYRDCEGIARGSNFYSGFRLLPAKKRHALSAVYAFMRRCDDISDNDGSAVAKRQQFAEWRAMFREAMRGEPAAHPTLPALCDTVRTYHIPVEYFYELIRGTEMDLTTASYSTFDELYRYCYRVASVVGLICIHIFGFREGRAKQYAEACGVAFQLTNILRDVKEDLQRGRIYLPLEDLGRFSYTEDDLRHEVIDERFRRLMAFEVERAQAFYLKGRPLLELIERDSRPAFWAMFESYETILQHIERRGYDVLCGRVRLRRREKLRIVLKALTKW
jgi:15-cis-phytoene synthase